MRLSVSLRDILKNCVFLYDEKTDLIVVAPSLDFQKRCYVHAKVDLFFLFPFQESLEPVI